jgi:hypothetical protein
MRSISHRHPPTEELDVDGVPQCLLIIQDRSRRVRPFSEVSVATARRSPVGFVNVPGNGLDAFECEPSAPPLLEVVDAYPEPIANPAVGARRTKPSVTLRRRLSSALRAIRAVAAFPFVIVAWFVLRLWWTIRLAVSGTWRVVTSAVMAIVLAARAVVAAIVFVGSLVARSAAAVAALSGTIVLGFSRAVTGTLRLCGAAIDGVTRSTYAAAARTVALIRVSLDTSGRLARSGSEFAVATAARIVLGSSRAVTATRRLCGVAIDAVTRGAQDAAARTLALTRISLGTSGRLARTGSAFVVATAARGRASASSAARRVGDATRSGFRIGAQATSRLTLRLERPAWVRPVRLVPALAVVLTLVAGLSTGAVMLLLSQRGAQRVARPAPSTPLLAAAVAEPLPVEVRPAVARAPVDRSVAQRRAVPPAASTPTRTAVTRPASVSVASKTPRADAPSSISAARVRAVWSQTDTRSLDRALTALRSITLAFRRCEMRMTSDDRAVARCDEVGGGAPGGRAVPVAWTIDFRRDEGRWLIDGLSSSRRTGSNR